MTDTMWRYLLHQDEPGLLSNATSSSTAVEYTSGQFDPKVFWGVNAFIFFLVTAACVWCCCFGGKENLMAWMSGEGRIASDMEYQMTLRQRHEARMAARRSTPAKRTMRLKRSFVRNKVQMVVQEGDIVQCDSMDITAVSSRSSEEGIIVAASPPDVETGLANSGSHGDDGAVDKHESDNETAATEGEPDADENADALAPETTAPVVAEEEAKPDATEAELATETQPVVAKETEPMATEPELVLTNSQESTFKDEGGEPLQAMEEGQPETTASNNTTTVTTNNEEQPINSDELPEADTGIYAPPTMDGLGGGNDDMAEHGYLVLRPGNVKNPPKVNPRMVPNCCAICLGEYEIDDTVVWSCHQECKHAFHQECILEWLLKIEDGGTPCPCCRQEFTDWETMRQERKIKWAAGHTFNASSVRLR